MIKDRWVSNIDIDRCMFLEAAIKFLEVYSLQEYGGYEVNIKEIAKFLFSDDFWIQTFDFKTIDDFYKSFENDILNGMPVWRFLKLPRKLMFQLELDFMMEQEKIKQKTKE